ncbi:MAG: hypothetical protein EOO96_06940 [Pedobacter sp.]|nr:MAG: hypothetical protein EOO96_06940 [Pedobacter sp.]
MNNSLKFFIATILVCFSFQTNLAHAQYFSPPDFAVTYVPASYWLMGNPGIGVDYDKPSSKSRKFRDKIAARPSTLIVLSKAPEMPAKLAAKYPVADRKRIEKLYNDMLVLYPSIAKKLKVAPNDLAGALAAFVAGSWTAYHSQDFKDEYFLPLTQQMRTLVGNTKDFKAGTLKEKQLVYEQMVIAGTLSAVTHEALKQKPNQQVRASLRASGEKYLKEFFKVDANRVLIGKNGVSIKK